MKLVVLGLSGVIVEPGESSEWSAIPGSLEAIARLNHLGFHVVVACNLVGERKAVRDLDEQGRFQRQLHSQLQRVGGHLDGFYFCPHEPAAACDCRLPQPGLLRQITQRLGTRITGIPFIGSNLRAIEAALAVDAQPVLVRTGEGAATEMLAHCPGDLPVFDDLAATVNGMFG